MRFSTLWQLPIKPSVRLLKFALLATWIAGVPLAVRGFAADRESLATPRVLTYAASPATSETRVTLRRQAGRIVITDDVTHKILARGRADRIERVIVRGVDGDHNDTLTVDDSGGLSLSGGIDYDGGNGGFDTLRIRGVGRSDVRHTATNGSDGVVELGATEIRYRNLEPVSDSVAGALTFNLPAGTVVRFFRTTAAAARRWSARLAVSSPSLSRTRPRSSSTPVGAPTP